MPREEQQEQYTRDMEIDPAKYYPADVARPPKTELQDPLTLPMGEMLKEMKRQRGILDSDE